MLDVDTSLSFSTVSLATLAGMIVVFMEVTHYWESLKKTATPPTPIAPLPIPGRYEELKRPADETEESNYVNT